MTATILRLPISSPPASPDVAPASAALTPVQQRIFIAQGVPCYRLPFVLEWADERDSDAEIAERVRAMVAACPTLAARYAFDPAPDTFVQTHDPTLAADLPVTDGGTVADLEADCADLAHQPDLRGAPLTARIVRHAGRRLLALEFHHLAIDGVGLAAVEKHLLGGPVVSYAPSEAYAAYDLVAQREAQHPQVRAGAWNYPTPRTPGGIPRTGRIGRVAKAAALTATARAWRVLPRIAAQAAFELAIARHLPGMTYATVGNWRWTLGLVDAVGNFPFLRHHDVPGDDLAAARVALMESSADPTLDVDVPLCAVPGIVFSYEQFAYKVGRFVPVDAFPKFPLYVRVAVEGPDLVVQADFDRTKLPDPVAEAVLDDVLAFALQESA